VHQGADPDEGHIVSDGRDGDRKDDTGGGKAGFNFRHGSRLSPGKVAGQGQPDQIQLCGGVFPPFRTFRVSSDRAASSGQTSPIRRAVVVAVPDRGIPAIFVERESFSRKVSGE
jgi:hypothetical protein